MINSVLPLHAVYEENTLQIWNRNKLPILKELKTTLLFEWLAFPYWPQLFKRWITLSTG